MIKPQLLTTTEGRSPGICIYGAAGLKKTHAISTLPPPVLMYDFEGGTSSIAPWIRRRKNSSETTWVNVSQDERVHALELLDPDVAKGARFKPGPFVDIIHFDNMRWESYNEFVEALGGFDAQSYNSLAIDSLQEFSVEAQTFSKGQGRELSTMNEIPFAWVQAQERAMVALRRLRNYRDHGIVVYLTGSEDISKDYVKNPMEKRAPGEAAPEPYSIRGTVNLPGKLAEGIAHIPDVLCHARLLSGSVTWVTQPEMLPGGGAWWDAKDRYGRLRKWINPNVYEMFQMIYGADVAKEIYAASREAAVANV